jgi:hypothetical protein
MEGPMLWTEWEAGDVWVQNAADGVWWVLLIWAGVALAVLLLTQLVVGPALKRRRFVCAQAGREVEVEFEERGLAGLRRMVAVRSCSVFDPPSPVQCRRSCLNPDARIRLPLSLVPSPQGRRP